MSTFTVKQVRSTLNHYDRLIREGLQRGNVLDVMNIHNPAIVCYIFFPADTNLCLGFG